MAKPVRMAIVRPYAARAINSAKPKSRVQSATRALRALEFLNSYSGATLAQTAEALELSRGTAYRILETMCDEGYVERDAVTGGYTLGARVRSLSDGYADEQWLRDFALERLYRLGEAVQWPLKLSTLQGFEMVVRASTDLRSPFAHLRTYAGHRVPLLRSAVGLVYLSKCSAPQRQLLIEMVRRSSPVPEDVAAANDRALDRRLNRVAQDGHAFIGDDHLSMVAVPVSTRRGIFACIAMQFYSRAISRKAVIASHVPGLHQAAADIGAFLDCAE
ncbi:MAG: helix-turn-helix domain-containing protein [Rhodobacteraceae bacterium]|nr:helix-turn-helix domain-containing protein [Paracoccaceae bacterium]